MGNRISIERCVYDFGWEADCSYNATWSGQNEKGDVPTEPDIAGVGVVYSFIAVTAFAALMSWCMLVWNGVLAVKALRAKEALEDVRRDSIAGKFNAAAIFDKLVTACSDQQIVVGSAYLWGVHNGNGCSMSFYHLIIVSNMIILSCATHLLCLVSTRRYYRNPGIAMVRLILIFVIIGYAGKLMSGGYTEGAVKLPTSIPRTAEEEAVLFLAAPCFMKRSRRFQIFYGDRLSDELDLPQWQDDDTSSRYLGWPMYLMIVSYSGLAVFVTWMRELFRPPPLEQKREPRGLRKVVHRRHDLRSFVGQYPRMLAVADWVYRGLGVGCATAAIVESAKAIVAFRVWAQDSDWLVAGVRTRSDEGDINDLGQLLAAFSCALVFFVLVEELFNELKAWRTRRQNALDDGSDSLSHISVPSGDSEVVSKVSGRP